MADLVVAGASQLEVPLGGSQVERLVAYVRLMERWNTTYNLTAIRDPRAMVVQHVLDCVAAVAALDRKRGTGRGERVVDVGSGAGLPGLVIAMTSPNRLVTCVDSVGKKAAFMRQASATLGLKNVTVLHARVEDVSGQFDVVASRAFSSLSTLVATTRHLLGDCGIWMAMKGKAPEPEFAELERDVSFHVEPLVVPQLNAERCIVWLERAATASARLS
ncbi:MAG TPA: 16S rRNA (guanine(527)-N(7))-methyltransferase RsmG [Caldimonas sp.]|nr:16S rRNA (guanine(527)-N(7))-methyltransferase RsmG [Caldimonas sp.]